MRSIMDWILAKTRLVEEEPETEDSEIDDFVEANDNRFSWLELVNRRKEKEAVSQKRMFFKDVRNCQDAQEVLDYYKTGCVCIIRMLSESHVEAQGIMNYICGGIYALDGTVVELGVNVFVALHEEDELLH